MFKTGQLCSDQLTLEATAGTAKSAIFQLQTNEATPSENGSNSGRWPRFNSELPGCFASDSCWRRPDSRQEQTGRAALSSPGPRHFTPAENMAQPDSCLGFALLSPCYHPSSTNSCTTGEREGITTKICLVQKWFPGTKVPFFFFSSPEWR